MPINQQRSMKKLSPERLECRIRLNKLCQSFADSAFSTIRQFLCSSLNLLCVHSVIPYVTQNTVPSCVIKSILTYLLTSLVTYFIVYRQQCLSSFNHHSFSSASFCWHSFIIMSRYACCRPQPSLVVLFFRALGCLFQSVDCFVQVSYPGHISPGLRHLLANLLQVDLTTRFGNMKNGCNDVKRHPWFSSIDWMAIFERQVYAYLPISFSLYLPLCQALSVSVSVCFCLCHFLSVCPCTVVYCRIQITSMLQTYIYYVPTLYIGLLYKVLYA